MTDQNKKKIEQPNVVSTKIITKNGTIILIYEDGTVKVIKDDFQTNDSSNPNDPPPPPPGH